MKIDTNSVTDAQEDELFSELYVELKKIAQSHMTRERPGHTLQATALVNEAYLKLMSSNRKVTWQSKKHFLCAAAEIMRRILVDSARARLSQKRGGNVIKLELQGTEAAPDEITAEILEIHEALQKLETVSPERFQLISLRFFAGLTIEEAAEVMNISRSKANRLWDFGRTWLYLNLKS